VDAADLHTFAGATNQLPGLKCEVMLHHGEASLQWFNHPGLVRLMASRIFSRVLQYMLLLIVGLVGGIHTAGGLNNLRTWLPLFFFCTRLNLDFVCSGRLRMFPSHGVSF
jgi:hypothetical protein